MREPSGVRSSLRRFLRPKNPPVWLVVAATLVLHAGLSSCTENSRARLYGGTAAQTLKGEKLVNVTWKDNNLWLLTRPWQAGDVAQTYTFGESSSWGFANGKVVITEAAPEVAK